MTLTQLIDRLHELRAEYGGELNVRYRDECFWVPVEAVCVELNNERNAYYPYKTKELEVRID